MPGGRPKKYNEKTLASAVKRYFNSITREIVLEELYDTGKKDKDGHAVYEKRQIINRAGKPAKKIEYLEPPTVGGLCEFLGIHRDTWNEYCDASRHPEFSDTTTRAQGRMRTWNERELLVRKDVRGIVFNLQNNYGYKEKQEMELGEQACRSIQASNMSLEEKLETIAKAAQGFAGEWEEHEDGAGD